MPGFGLLTPRLGEVEAHQIGNQRIGDGVLLGIAIVEPNLVLADALRFKREQESGAERGEAAVALALPPR